MCYNGGMTLTLEPNTKVLVEVEPEAEAYFVEVDATEIGLEQNNLLEVVDDQWVEKNVSFRSSTVAAELVRRLGNAVYDHGGGDFARVCGSDLSYAIETRGKRQIRRPDASVVLATRLANVLPEGKKDIGIFPSAPDLAIEVISPLDQVGDLEQKLQDYRDGKFPRVWIVNIDTRRTQIRDANGITEIPADETIDLSDLIPGFSLRLADVLA
jgi:Uma2 family endonuclease